MEALRSDGGSIVLTGAAAPLMGEDFSLPYSETDLAVLVRRHNLRPGVGSALGLLGFGFALSAAILTAQAVSGSALMKLIFAQLVLAFAMIPVLCCSALILACCFPSAAAKQWHAFPVTPQQRLGALGLSLLVGIAELTLGIVAIPGAENSFGPVYAGLMNSGLWGMLTFNASEYFLQGGLFAKKFPIEDALTFRRIATDLGLVSASAPGMNGS